MLNYNEVTLKYALKPMYKALNGDNVPATKVTVKGKETIEILNATLKFNAYDKIRNLHNDLRYDDHYIKCEIEWYLSQNLSNKDIGKVHHMWANSGDANGMVNSNYGYLLFSPQNGNQYQNVIKQLKEDKTSRRAVAYYTNPMMHYIGGNDHICTAYVAYTVREDELHAIVSMRSCDVRRGLVMSDLPWQQYILRQMANELYVLPGWIHWHCVSMHMYSKYFHILNDIFLSPDLT
ncbi:MAG: thymidylate synthase [Sulfurimonas sp.]|uniref:thymidylate synthase n=1 Tax=Sulfurimonas sp. TaxID=2022749 RepID=UPI003D0F36E4